MRDTVERRIEILQILSIRRNDIIENLAFELSVHINTIKNDISRLSISFPIYTIQGNGGGIYVDEDWYFGVRYFTYD